MWPLISVTVRCFLSSFYERALEFDQCCNRKKLGKLVNKQNCYLNFIYNIIIVQVKYITILTNILDIHILTGFFPPHSCLGEVIDPTHLDLHMREKNIISNSFVSIHVVLYLIHMLEYKNEN